MLRATVRTGGVGWLLPALALGLGACSKTDPLPGAKRPGAGAPVPVEVAMATQRDVPVQIRGIARVEAYTSITVKPQVTGQLMKTHIVDGQDVKAGEHLFSIDARPFEAALRQAEATLAKDQALAKNAREEAERVVSLYQQKVATQLEYDTALALADAADATVLADKAAADNARLQLQYCSIQCSMDGRAGKILVDPGNIVTANVTMMVVVNQVRPIYVTFAVPERYLPQIRQYQATGSLGVDAVIPQEQGPPEHGVLTFIDNQVDSTTGMISLKGTFANESRRLWPGQFANAILTLTTESGAVVVPSQAVQSGQNGQFVFVVKEDQSVDLRPVVAGQVVGSQTVIQSGIAVGDTVVTDGQLRLTSGVKVTIKPHATTEAATTQGAGR